jgi:hypothetical protein
MVSEFDAVWVIWLAAMSGRAWSLVGSWTHRGLVAANRKRPAPRGTDLMDSSSNVARLLGHVRLGVWRQLAVDDVSVQGPGLTLLEVVEDRDESVVAAFADHDA